ncbi:hypothetical protein Golomagni_07695, partial [Golovinomyces magnicellulatus]
PRQEHGTVGISSTKLAIIGGIIPNPDEGSSVPFNTTRLMQIYDTKYNRWSSAADLPIAVNHPNFASHNGRIYLLGGLADSPDGAWRAFPESWVYDTAKDTWNSIPAMPDQEKRGSAAAGVYKDVIYLAGGMRTLNPIGTAGEQDTVAFVSAFDTKSMSWSTLPPLPEGRDHAGVSVVGHKMYVLGGRYRGQYKVKDTVFILDLNHVDSGWKTSKARMPTPRGGVVSGTIQGKVYIFGGEGNPEPGANGVFDQVEVFDTKTESWKKLKPMKVPRHGGSGVALGNAVYLPGGGWKEGGSPLALLDAYYP